MVDISDTSQSAHGSFDSITVANFFATIPAPVNVTSASATALAVGRLGATTPAFTVDASTALQVAGLKVTGAVTLGTVAVVVTTDAGAANLTINAALTGTIGIGSISTGRVTITPVTTITGLLTLTAGVAGALTSGIGGSASSNQAKQTQTLFVGVNMTAPGNTGADASFGTYTLPASALGTNGATLRISIRCTSQCAAATYVKFGGTRVTPDAGVAPPPAGYNLSADVMLTRLGATTQQALGITTVNSTGFNNAFLRSLPTETLSGAITVDFRSVNTTGNTIDFVCVELITP